MTRDLLIRKTIDRLTQLPDQKLQEVSDFAEFLLKGIEDRFIMEGIQKLTSDSKTYEFLEKDEDLYSVSDLKERYQ